MSVQSNKQSSPSLFAKLWIRYILLPLFRFFLSWRKAEETFLKEGNEILDIVKTLSVEQLHQRIKVSHIRGLEETACNLSPAMILAHLVHTGSASQSAIISLSQNTLLDFTINMDEYEASTKINVTVIQEFEQFINDYSTILTYNVDNHAIDNTLTHPWFGPLNPHKWLILSVIHQRMHLAQLRQIVASYQENKLL